MLTIPQLRAQTTPLPHRPNIATFVSLPGVVSFSGAPAPALICCGHAASISSDAPPGSSKQYHDFRSWWQQLYDTAEIRNTYTRAGTGLIALCATTFPEPDEPAVFADHYSEHIFTVNRGIHSGSLVIPQVVVGYDDDAAWLTLIGPIGQDVFDTLDPLARQVLDHAVRPPA
ncbi:hypothetical protein [Trueperella sp. LYQ143]|uniref:hypothetical protein n=1 Tax=unclassified Trueperella TaxID=2630174 RepID=UPI0039838703